jgi:hypothetical protein
MKLSVVFLCVAVVGGSGFANPSSAAEACLSPARLHEAARMAAVMGIGAGLRRCGQCLGPDQYSQTLDEYDSAGLMREFSTAQVTLKGADRNTAEYVDTIVRQHARIYAETLSGDCEACRQTAHLVQGLSSAEARDKFYEREAGSLAGAPDVKICP